MTETQATESKKIARRAAKRKLVARLKAEPEFAKTYFGAKSKRSADKKTTFIKKKTRKKA